MCRAGAGSYQNAVRQQYGWRIIAINKLVDCCVYVFFPFAASVGKNESLVFVTNYWSFCVKSYDRCLGDGGTNQAYSFQVSVCIVPKETEKCEKERI